MKSKWEEKKNNISGSKHQDVSGIDPSSVKSIGIFVAYLQPMRKALHTLSI